MQQKINFICEYVSPNGSLKATEKIPYSQYYHRVNIKWSQIQQLAGGTARLWPAYVLSLFSNTKQTHVQNCQLAAFIVINSIEVIHIIEWFGLLGTSYEDRYMVYRLVKQLTTSPRSYSLVFAFSVKQLRHKYLYGGYDVIFKKTKKG